MKRVRARVRHDERGTALLLAIAFMLVIGAISGALLTSITSGLNSRHSLDQARNREYAADGVVEYAIANARATVVTWDTTSLVAFLNSATAKGCGGPYASSLGNVPSVAHLNNVDIHVDCAPAPAQTRGGYLQRNAIFTACLDTGTTCTDNSTIVRAQVNFSDSGTTTVQAWSVDG